MEFVELIQQQCLSPDIFKEEELVEFHVIQDEEVEDLALGGCLVKEGLGFDPEHVVHAVESQVPLLRLLVLLFPPVE